MHAGWIKDNDDDDNDDKVNKSVTSGMEKVSGFNNKENSTESKTHF